MLEDRYLNDEQIQGEFIKWAKGAIGRAKATSFPQSVAKKASDHTLKVIVEWLRPKVGWKGWVYISPEDWQELRRLVK